MTTLKISIADMAALLMMIRLGFDIGKGDIRRWHRFKFKSANLAHKRDEAPQ